MINKMIDFLKLKKLYSISYKDWKTSSSKFEKILVKYLERV